jgi:hypothetical protein
MSTEVDDATFRLVIKEMGSKIQEACNNGNGKSSRLLHPTQQKRVLTLPERQEMVVDEVEPLCQ